MPSCKNAAKHAERVVSKIVREFELFQSVYAKNTRIEQTMKLGRWTIRIARDLGITSTKARIHLNDIIQGLWYAEWVRETARKRKEND